MRRPDVFTLDYSHPLAQRLVFAGMSGIVPGAIDQSLSYNNRSSAYGVAPTRTYEIGRTAWRLGDLFSVRLSDTQADAVYSSVPLCVSVWVRILYARTGREALFSSRRRYTNYGFVLYLQDMVPSCFSGYGDPSSIIQAPVALSVGEWAHVLGQVVNGTAYLWVNGFLVGSVAASPLWPSDFWPVFFGEANYDGVSFVSSLEGADVADPVYYNRPLSPAEIAILADRTDPMLGGLIVEERPVLYFDMGGSTGVTGTMSATESGTDTFSATGQLLISGLMSVAEIGVDTASILGVLPVQGTVSAVETDTDAAASSGVVLVQGDVAAQEAGSDTAQIYGGALPTITGSVAASESGADSAEILAQLLISGLVAASEIGADTCAVVGTSLPVISGSVAATESGVDTCAVSGVVTDTLPISPDEVARVVTASARMKTVTASARAKAVRYAIS